MKLYEIFDEQRIILEFLDLNGYGCWLNANTGESFKVKEHSHSIGMKQYLEYHDIDYGPCASSWAAEHGWIRISFNHHDDKIKIESETKPLLKVWPQLLSVLEKFTVIRIDILQEGNGSLLKELRFELPEDLRKLKNFGRVPESVDGLFEK